MDNDTIENRAYDMTQQVTTDPNSQQIPPTGEAPVSRREYGEMKGALHRLLLEEQQQQQNQSNKTSRLTQTIADTLASQQQSRGLPDPEFVDKKVSAFPVFGTKLTAKVDIYRHRLGRGRERDWMMYGFNRLTGMAAQRVNTWITTQQNMVSNHHGPHS